MSFAQPAANPPISNRCAARSQADRHDKGKNPRRRIPDPVGGLKRNLKGSDGKGDADEQEEKSAKKIPQVGLWCFWRRGLSLLQMEVLS